MSRMCETVNNVCKTTLEGIMKIVNIGCTVTLLEIKMTKQIQKEQFKDHATIHNDLLEQREMEIFHCHTPKAISTDKSLEQPEITNQINAIEHNLKRKKIKGDTD